MRRTSNLTIKLIKESLRRFFQVVPLIGISIFAVGQTVTQTITATGAGTFNIPAGVNTVTVEVWGGGGGGGNSANTTQNGGGGGGGGAYSRKVFSGALPVSFDYFVGSGGAGAPGSSTTAAVDGQDTWFDSNNSLMAKGGAKGNNNINGSGSQGLGGASASGFGDVKFSGGNGANATNDVGGAGGGSAGSSSIGNNGSGSGTTAAVTDGGTGGNGGTTGNPGGNGGAPGGGGGGSNDIATEPGGNGGNGQIRITYTLPTVLSIVRQSPASTTTNETSVTFRVIFSENVSNVSADGSDFALSGTATGSINSVTEQTASTVFDVEVTGVSGNGNLNLDFGSHDIVSTSTGNAFNGVIDSEQEYTVDTQGPSVTNVTSTTTDGTYKLDDIIAITVTFDDNVTVNTTGGTPQITLETGTVDRAVNYSSGSGTSTLTFNYTVQAGDVNSDLDYVSNSALSLNGGTLKDAVGNDAVLTLPDPGTANSLGNNKNLVVDGVAPTVTINQGAAQTDPTSSSPITFDILFSEPVTGFTSGDITLGGTATLQSVNSLTTSDGGTTWTLTINTSDPDGGTVAPTIGAGVAFDAAGNGNMTSTSTDNSVTFSPAPTVTVNQAIGQADLTNSNPINFTAVFSKAINPLTFDNSDITVAGTATATAGTPTTSDNITWNIPITATSSGTIIVSMAAARVQDLLGNDNEASTSTDNTVTFDNVAPVVISVTSNATSAGTLKIGDQIIFTVDIQTTEPGLTISPTTYNGGTLTWSTSNGGDTYTATYTVVSGQSDRLTPLQLTNVTATDAAMNTSGTVSGTDVAKTIDANNPPAFTTGTLATTGGTVVSGYWNSTNTGLNVAVPVPADVGGQFSLNGGTITIEGRVGAGTFAVIGGVSVPIGPADPGSTKTVSLTEAQFESITGFAEGVTVQLRAVITDAAGNSTTGGTSATNIVVDQTAPATNTVGSLTPTGGRVVLLYYNSTNTGLNVVVPMSNSDASLDGGSVQVRLKMTSGPSFTNVLNSGVSTITNGQRTAGTKTVSVTATDLESTSGFSDGAAPGFRASETNFLLVTVRVTDVAGNFVDYTPSTTEIDVDQTPPAVVSNLFTIYANAGSGGRDAIQFVVSEPMTDHAATPAQRGHDFAFISSDNTYGNSGVSVGGGTTTDPTNDVRYFNNGNTNSLDGGLTNTRVVYVESKNNSANWSVAAGTRVRYVQLGTASTAASVMRDPAGNELSAFDIAVTSGAATTLGPAFSNISGTPIANSSIGRVVFAFSLTSTASINLSDLSIATTSDPSLILKNFKLYSVSGSDNFFSATDLGYTATTTANSVSFNSISVPLSATTTYFYLVCDVNDYFFSANPQIQFSLESSSLPNAGGGFTLSSGGYAGTTQTGTLYTFNDGIAPGIVSITNVVNPINLSNLTQTVRIQFNEPMNNSTAASPGSITITPQQLRWSPFAGGTWSTTALTNDTYTVTLTHDGLATTNSSISNISNFSGLTDWGGNGGHGSASSASFIVDTQRPTISAGGIGRNLNIVNLNNNTILITVRYNESMNTSVAPTITFSNGTFGAGVPVSGLGFTNGWTTFSLTNDTYQAYFTNSTTNEDFASVTASANNAQDANGNNQTVSGTTPSFIVDTQRPTVVSINRTSPTQLTNATSVTFRVVFSEAMQNASVNPADFTPVAVSGSLTFGTPDVSLVSSTTYDVIVPVTGDGHVRLDVNGGTATLNDSRGNALNTGRTGDQLYTIDQTPPKLISLELNPALKDAHSSTINGFTPSLHSNTMEFIYTFSEPVINFVFDGGYITGEFVLESGQPVSGYPLAAFTTPFDVTPASGPSDTWTFHLIYTPGVGGVAGTGRIQANYENANNSLGPYYVTDEAGNPVANNDQDGNPFQKFAGPYYNIALEEPAASVTSFTTSSVAPGTSLTVNWIDVAGSNATTPTHYLVILSTLGTPPPVADGTYINDDDDLGDGVMFHNVAKGLQSTTFSGLTDGTDYTIFIYPYTWSPNTEVGGNRSTINFRTTSPATASRASDIVKNTFAYNSDILYKNFQATNIPDGSGTGSIVLEQFNIRDGGGANDADNLNTHVSSITFEITNFQNLRQLAIYDGTTEVAELNVAANIFVADLVNSPNVGQITFGGLTTLVAPDNGNKVFSLRASFIGTGAKDNDVISFKVVSIAASSTTPSSQFKSTLPVGVQSALSGDQNRIAVVAEQIEFTTIPATASVSEFITVQVSATDSFGNLDEDYDGTITETGTSPAGTFSTDNDPTGPFAGGKKDYPFNFHFDSGNGNVSLTIRASAGSGGGGPIEGISPVISLITSFESLLISKRYLTPATRTIDYINYVDDDDDIENTSSTTTDGYELDFIYLVDGGQNGIDVNGNPVVPDQDSAPTVLDDLTFAISNPQSIRRIAIYTRDPGNNSLTEIQELDDSDIVLHADGYGVVSFEDLNINAPDNGRAQILVLATFHNTPAVITDNDVVRIAILSATMNSGSQFAPGTIGGFSGSSFTLPEATQPATVGSVGFENTIQVIATRLDFVTQPNDYAGIRQPIDATTASAPPYSGVVHARDVNGIIDLDVHNITANVTAAANPVMAGGFIFQNGVLDLADMQYTQAPKQSGNGTLTVQALGLSSSTPPSIACEQVDVLNVVAVENTDGVLTTTSLKGGNINQTIFGFTFDPINYHVTASEPRLKEFAITFKKDTDGDNDGILDPYFYKTDGSTVLKNFKIYESTTGLFAGATNISGTGVVTITETTSPYALSLGASPTAYDMVKVTFNSPSDYRNLFGAGNPSRTYYLQVDVDVSTNIGTPAITPYLENRGYGDPTYTQVQVTEGSAVFQVKGTTRTFASTKPPSLVSSSPYSGQLNVDPALDAIYLTFDVPVTTFDHTIYLYERYSGTLYATLTAENGKYEWQPGQSTSPSPYVVKTLKFLMPEGLGLIPDSVYYVKINAGSFEPSDPTRRSGISDDGFNLFGGISFSGTLYFKAASPNPPKMVATNTLTYYSSKSSVSINASFDQRGKAYFMITNPGASAPTNAEIDGSAGYAGGTVYGRGTIDIKNIYPDNEWGTVNAELASGDYDVWIYAENDALPMPIPTTAPYGKGGTFMVGDAGPTTTLKITSAADTALVNWPTYQVCSNSYSRLTNPLIFSERHSQEFTTSGVQSFSLVLPTGFQFDVKTLPTVKFNGSDFVGTGTAEFFNTTILRISFRNDGLTGSLDNIIITDLVVIASSSNIAGGIRRFSGNAIPTIADGKAVAKIISGSNKPIDFTNSYSNAGNFSSLFGINSIVTYVPDNYLDAALNNTRQVRLLPLPTKGDYGPSAFSGPGVTDDILSLTSVQLNTGFNITLTHTDMNGCKSDIANQYTVYDHLNAIPQLGTLSSVTGERQICITNNNFPDPSTTPIDVTALVPGRGKAGFQLLELYANIPGKATSGTQIMTNGSAWQDLVVQIPVINSEEDDQATGNKVLSYNWNYNPVLNAGSSGLGLDDPYNYFIEKDRDGNPVLTPINGSRIYRGGSLGIVEFTGKYQSTADYSVIVPFRQEVEVFVPSIPVVEAAGQSAKAGDTLIYCQKGAAITIAGYPLATAGVSTGSFTLYDAATNNVITSGGFTDNGNGTGTLDPDVVFNEHQTIRVIRVDYTFKENNSPCSGTGSMYIRITPNPVPDYTTSTLCEDIDVQFTDASNFGSAIGQFSVTEWQWNFGDANSGLSNTSIDQNPLHTYNTPGLYNNVSLAVKSEFGCPSVSPALKNLEIGATPGVKFQFTGVSTADSFQFSAHDATGPSTKYTNDTFARFDWNFGDNSDLPDNVAPDPNTWYSHTYSSVGPMNVTLTVTTGYGCVGSLEKKIVVLPQGPAISSLTTYMENFETNDSGNWQKLAFPVSSDPSWQVISDGNLGSSNFWITRQENSLTYSTEERSALYSPSFDFSSAVRPMLSFNSLVRLDPNSGVVLQYSTDNYNIVDPQKQWQRLGEIGTGIDWYNKPGIAGQPGIIPSGNNLGDLGWSDHTTEWLDSRHALAELVGQGKVVFRFAFASSKDNQGRQGFAIDNVRIGERTRTVLIENFSNKGNVAAIDGLNLEKRESDWLKSNFANGVGTDVVKVVYHVGFPGQDPFNNDNLADPGARALFYNISETPIVRLDGSGSENGLKYFSEWGMDMFNKRALKLAHANLQINASDADGDGIYEVGVDITAIEDLPENTLLFVGVLEELTPLSSLSTANQSLIKTGENNFEYVLRKMLPSGLGTRFNTQLSSGQARSFGPFEWKPGNLYAPTNDLAIVAFIQNEVTREVYQTVIILNINDPSPITGTEDPEFARKILIFPNPADDEMHIMLPEQTKNAIPIRLIDSFGREVYQSTFEKGEQSKVIRTQNIANGVYFIQLETPQGAVRKKVMVVH